MDHTARGTGTSGHLKLHLQGQLNEDGTGTDVEVQTLTPLLMTMWSKIYCNHTQKVCQPLGLLQIRKPESNLMRTEINISTYIPAMLVGEFALARTRDLTI
jgi:hypothetical protein